MIPQACSHYICDPSYITMYGLVPTLQQINPVSNDKFNIHLQEILPSYQGWASNFMLFYKTNAFDEESWTTVQYGLQIFSPIYLQIQRYDASQMETVRVINYTNIVVDFSHCPTSK